MDDHSEIKIEEPNAPVQPKSSFWQRRIFVIALTLSFLACLAAFSLAIDFFHLFNQVTPQWIWLVPFVANNRIILIIAPLFGLIISAAALCYVTRDIMSGPTRYLDERQKMIREQAHSSAYTIMKFVVIIGILGLALSKMLLPDQNSSVTSGQSMLAFTQLAPEQPVSPLTWTMTGSDKTLKSAPKPTSISKASPIIHTTYTNAVRDYALVKPYAIVEYIQQPSFQVQSPNTTWSLQTPWPSTTQWPMTTTSTIFFYGTLLLCLLVMISTLPKAVAAWNKRI